MKNLKWWQKILVVIGLILVISVVYIFWPVKEDLSYLASSGDGYNVTILRDSWGVAHVFGETDTDTAYGMAYAHAEDDFYTIQQVLALSRGVMGQIEGPDAAPIDFLVQLLRIPETVDAKYDTEISPEIRDLVEAYADGINHYAALHNDEALPRLFPVTGKDVISGYLLRTTLFFGLHNVVSELYSEERQREVSEKVTAGLDERQLNGNKSLTANNLFDLPIGTGSNTLAVSPNRSANGETFLAVNAHQPWEGPVTWYEIHLHSEEGWDAVGGTFPGAPMILHGHNRDVGWAFTVNNPDLVDVYVLEINPDNPNQYRFDGEWLDLEVRQVPLKVKLIGRLFWTVKQEALWSVYGPAVRQDHGTYAIRYASMGEVGYAQEWFEFNKARNFEEWQSAIANGPLQMFNAGYADKEGNIYYLYNGRIPIRAEGYDWAQYLPGNTSETLWTEYLPFEKLPQVLNPPSGFIQNTNDSPFKTTTGPGNPNPDEYSVTLGIETDDTNRGLRALELFGADESITADEFYTYKYDMAYSTDSFMARYMDMIRALPVQDDPVVQAGIELLKSWDMRTDPNNRGAALAILTIQPLGYEFEEVEESELLESLTEAVHVLKQNHGRIDVAWQEVNRLRRGEVNLGLGGGPDILHAVYGRLEEDGRLYGTDGDSYVLLVTWDAEGKVSSQSIHQYGSATLDESSPHYADQSPLFVRQELKPVWLDEAEIRDNLESAYRPGEEVGP